jgi:xanthine dehydrogenase accessory factor
MPVVLENGDNDPNAFLLPKDLLADAADRTFAGTGIWRRVYGLNQYMVQSVMPKEILYICGAGHVGYQLGRLARIVDFSTVVMDDRPEFADPLRFPYAREVKVIPEFTPLFDGFDVNENSYIVILTRGHLYNQIVLEQALDAVYSPIGTAIKTETPAEIAVSIMGELILVRAEHKKGKGKSNAACKSF